VHWSPIVRIGFGTAFDVEVHRICLRSSCKIPGVLICHAGGSSDIPDDKSMVSQQRSARNICYQTECLEFGTKKFSWKPHADIHCACVCLRYQCTSTVVTPQHPCDGGWPRQCTAHLRPLRTSSLFGCNNDASTPQGSPLRYSDFLINFF